jgi:hypothetical protein
MEMQNVTSPKLSLHLVPAIFRALEQEAREQGREVGEQAQWVLTDHVIRQVAMEMDSSEPAPDAKAYLNRQRLGDRLVEIAVGIKRHKGITPNLTEAVCTEVMMDGGWMASYSEYIGGDAFGRNNAKKASINREFGMRICRAIEAKVAKNPKGKTLKKRVDFSFISSCTLFVEEPAK